jgi:glycerophosphoryl diester phosphodiesterase
VSLASFVQAHSLEDGNTLPQAISHRGYKAKYPENTLLSMRKAVEAGTHALETDIHLSKDGVVVLSHDPTLKRCYGKPDKIIDCEWEYLSTLRTIGENPQPMPRLLDLLEYLASPGLEGLWVLLDIKVRLSLTPILPPSPTLKLI